MKVKQIVTAINDYKKTGLLVAFPKCDFKCCVEQHIPITVCQNSHLGSSKSVDISVEKIIGMYDSDIHNALICGGLEPLDTYEDLLMLIDTFREGCEDDIVIFTGYNFSEISREVLTDLKSYGNIVIKVGRYIQGNEPHFDETLGIELASENQFGIRLEDITCL